MSRSAQRTSSIGSRRCELFVDHGLVGDPGHDALGADLIGHRIDSEDGNRSAVRLEQSGYHPQCRGLAGAVGPEQRVELATGNDQVQAIHGRAVEPLREPANFQRERYVRRFPRGLVPCRHDCSRSGYKLHIGAMV